jgi:hypothetical protein
MSDSNPLARDLAQLLAKHGVNSLPSATTAGPQAVTPGSAVASYIKEIITGNQAFDEQVLSRVVNVLKPSGGG